MISPGFQEDFLDLVNGVYHVLYMLLRYVFHLLTEPALEMIYILKLRTRKTSRMP